MLSKTSEYALRAVLFLARESRDIPVPAGDIATGLDVPANYLSKILHTLSRAGVVSSERGPGGGYRLARPGLKYENRTAGPHPTSRSLTQSSDVELLPAGGR